MDWQQGNAAFIPVNFDYNLTAVEIMIVPLICVEIMQIWFAVHLACLWHPVKCALKLLIHSQTGNIAPLKFGNGQVVSPHILKQMMILIHAAIKVKPR